MTPLSDKNGSDKDLPDEQQLDEYLRGGSAVSQQYRQLRSEDVPAELDRLVLHQAQEAVRRPAKSRTWMRWAGPLALAASTVLVVSIVIESGVHEDTYLAVPVSAPADLPPKQEEAAEQAREADKAARDASVVHVVPLEMETRAPAFVPPPEVAEAPPPVEPKLEKFAVQPVAPAAPAPAPQLDDAQPSPETTGIVSPPARAFSRSREEGSAIEEAVVTAQKRSERKLSAGPHNTVAAPAADEQADEPRNYSDPERWLRDIRQLRKQNKQEEADREWRRFRYVFPDYEVAETDPARGAAR